ncbi:MAG: outer membrane lipoprotein-sorting protein, partial [Woeseiaceae bacterium]|nr:outer membrane lipoprotein-sorting protein [Woeseiaceae bacterium]
LLSVPAVADDAAGIIQAAVDHWRGLASYSEITMIIHRPDWERSMSMRAWTKGDDRSLVRVTAPARDQGNATLTNTDNMWTYSPKVNRVIKIPSSMMNQSWMGSDFSNKDISREDDLLDKYVHTLLSTSLVDGHTVNEIESVPLEDAAIVWGKEVLQIREDHVVLSHSFYDQDGVLVKSLHTLEIAMMGDRNVAARQRMQKQDAEGEWTELKIDAINYDAQLDDTLFTLSSLRNPRN